MKKQLIAVAAFSAFATLAHAQSSVTLYGVINEGLDYISNKGGGRVIGLISGQTNGSRWGLRGKEDLGGGLSTIFDLENGFDGSAGTLSQGGRLFGRAAWVGLHSDQFGSLTMGRQYDAMHDDVGERLAATGMWAWIGSHAGDFDNLNANFRMDGSVRYQSPTIAGFKVDLEFAPGAQAGSFATSRRYQLAGTYSQGPIYGVVAYENLNNVATSVYDATVARGQTGFTSPGKSASYSGFLSANSQTIFAAGLGYKFAQGDQIAFVYTHTTFDGMLRSATTPNVGNASLNSYEANVRYMVTPFLQVAAAYDYSTVRAQTNSANYQEFIAGPDYLLSKATDIQLAGVWQHATGTNSLNKQAVADIGSLGNSTSPTQVAVKLMLRHRF